MKLISVIDRLRNDGDLYRGSQTQGNQRATFDADGNLRLLGKALLRFEYPLLTSLYRSPGADALHL